MAQDSTPAIVIYQGDGSNNVFSIPFDKGYYGEVKVAFVRRGLANYIYEPNTYVVNGRLYAWFSATGYVYTHTPNPAVGADIYNNFDEPTGDTVSSIAGQTITVDDVVYSRSKQNDIENNLLLTWTGDTLEVGDYICIIRETEREQPFVFPNNQKHIEGALDNLERQIQEVANKTDNALLVDPSHATDSSKMNPVDWLKTIVRSLDLSVRGLKYSNEWVLYSTDDPNIAEADKTWVRLLNTDNIKNIRESVRYDEEHNPIYYVEYKDQNGQWKTLSDAADWESRIAKCEEDVAYAVETSEDAKDVAQDAYDKVDAFDDRLTQAEQDASDAKDIAQNASDAVSLHITDTNNPHSVTAAQVGALPNTTKYGSALSLTINSTTYVLTAQLKDQDGNNLGTAQTIDLPLESVVVSGSYDSATKEVVLTLQGGSTIRFSVADLVSGLQTEITALNMLSADLVDDTNTTHKFVTTTEKSTWNGKQDSISDLATIRSGAAAGATAVQPSDLATYVTTNTTQTISGEKTFSGKLNYCAGMTYILAGNGGTKLGYWSYDVDGGNNITLQTMTASTRNINFKTNNGGKVTYNGSEIAKVSNIPTTTSALTNDSGFITNAVNDLQNYTLTSSLATVATSGSYNDLSNKPTIPTVNNPTITITQGGVEKGSFTLNQATGGTIALDAGGGVGNIDNITITANADQEIQAVAVIDQNTGIAKTWTGTMAEYEAIVTKDPETEYIITDDIGGSATEIGEITEDINDLKEHTVIEFQAPTAENNYTWYRKYADGWVEQGQSRIAAADQVVQVTFPVEMADEYYVWSIGRHIYQVTPSNTNENFMAVINRTTTGFIISDKWGHTYAWCWQVSGMAA